MKKSWRVDDAIRDQIASDLRVWGTHALAAKYGVSRQVIRNVRRERGIAPHPRGSPPAMVPTVRMTTTGEKTRHGKPKPFRLAWPCCPRGRALLHWALT